MSNDNLFERAKRVGLGVVKIWLPDGRQEGSEWVAINPTRPDNSKGSFKVNLKSGKWAEFAGGKGGNDIISLYAYLHEDRLIDQAKRAGYKNIDGAIQAEAAKEILTTYDNSYFPEKDDFFVKPEEKKSKGDPWDGWYSVVLGKTGLKGLPQQSVEWYEKKWGAKKAQWNFSKDNRLVMRVVRFVSGRTKNNGKLEKEDRPFTVWTDGQQQKWRCKAPAELYPLWNQDKLEDFPNKRVLLFEGQKDAEIMDKYLESFISVGWYGGSKAGAIAKSDWSILTGREVFYSFDADPAGRQAITAIRKLAAEHSFKLYLVFPPKDCKAGWSLADQTHDWSEARYQKFIKENSDDQIKDSTKFIDDNPFEFKILGYSGEYITFYPYGSKKVVKYKATSINKATMFTLMDRDLWGEYFAKDDGGVAWDSATNFILRRAEEAPVFNPSIVRGAGAWIDQGKLIVNTGNKLIIDKKTVELYENFGDLVFERGLPMPYEIDNQVSKYNIRFLTKMINKLQWKDQVCAELLLGWILLAPFGGALRWRPHLWITGAKGSGKSWILEHILFPLVGDEFGIEGKGSSTPPGIRSGLGNSAKATIMDEMESDNPKYAEYIDQNLKMFREASSGFGGAKTFHGTADGEGRQWIVQSMAVFASIGASIKHGADKSRFTLLPLFNPGEKMTINQSETMFEELQKDAQNVTRMLGRSIVSRTLSLWDHVQKAIMVFTSQLAVIFGNRRQADQVGTLLAGAWMFQHDVAPTAAGAKEYLERVNIEFLIKSYTGKRDEERCLDEILSYKIEVTDGQLRSKVSVSMAIIYWFSQRSENPFEMEYKFPGADANAVKSELQQLGIKLIKCGSKINARFACDHTKIKYILRNTPWENIYEDLLLRLKSSASEIKGPDRFAGIQKRFVEIDVQKMLDIIPF